MAKIEVVTTFEVKLSVDVRKKTDMNGDPLYDWIADRASSETWFDSPEEAIGDAMEYFGC